MQSVMKGSSGVCGGGGGVRTRRDKALDFCVNEIKT